MLQPGTGTPGHQESVMTGNFPAAPHLRRLAQTRFIEKTLMGRLCSRAHMTIASAGRCGHSAVGANGVQDAVRPLIASSSKGETRWPNRAP